MEMGTFQRSTTFIVPLPNGQTITVTTTYTATYLDPPAGPGITRHELRIEPCDLVGSAALDAIRSQITEWTAERVLDARTESGVAGASGETATTNAARVGDDLYNAAKGCAEVADLGDATSVTACVDENGQTSAEVTLEDGTRFDHSLDNLDVEPWSEEVTRTDAEGRTDSVETTYDDGSRTATDYDQDDSQDWSEQTTETDSQGRTDGVETTYDDGSKTTTDYDQGHTDAWTEQTTRTHTEGRTVNVDTHYDDGSRHMVELDDAGQMIWEYDQAPDGSSTLIHEDGTTVDSDGSQSTFLWSNQDGTAEL